MPRRAVYLAQMFAAASRSATALTRNQERALIALVRHAGSRVPLYQDLFAERHVDPDRFTGLSAIAELPIVDKQILRDAGARAISRDAPARRVTISTSGSTGEPFSFPIDRTYDLWRKAQFLRPYLSSGRRLTDSVLRLTTHPTQQMPWHSRLGILREYGISCAASPDRVARLWRDKAPDILMGYPSALQDLAHHCLESRQPLRPAPRQVFTDSELLTPGTRELIEQAFGVGPIDIYGTWETDNIAWQCASGSAYHVATDSVILEIVRDGVPVPAGEPGEIVVTVLRNTTSPMIRYNLRDVARLSTAPCPCGLPFPLMADIQGRSNDAVVLVDGRRRSGQDLIRIMQHLSHAVRRYQFRQRAIGQFELLIVPAAGYTAEVERHLAEKLSGAVEGARFTIRTVDAIPREESGKLRAFVSEVRNTG